MVKVKKLLIRVIKIILMFGVPGAIHKSRDAIPDGGGSWKNMAVQ